MVVGVVRVVVGVVRAVMVLVMVMVMVGVVRVVRGGGAGVGFSLGGEGLVTVVNVY